MTTSTVARALTAVAEQDSPAALIVNAGAAEQVAAKCLELGITSVFALWVTDYAGLKAQTNSLVDAQRLATALGLHGQAPYTNDATGQVHLTFASSNVSVVTIQPPPVPHGGQDTACAECDDAHDCEDCVKGCAANDDCGNCIDEQCEKPGRCQYHAVKA